MHYSLGRAWVLGLVFQTYPIMQLNYLNILINNFIYTKNRVYSNKWMLVKECYVNIYDVILDLYYL